MKLTKFAQRYKSSPLELWARTFATSDFMAGFDDRDVFPHLPKLPDGYIYSPNSGVCLTMKGVEPHFDDMVGETVRGYKFVGGAFGLTKGYCTLHVGKEYEKLGAGDWVMFDDGIAHSVFATAKWYGFAVQILKKRQSRVSKHQ
jgi:hypothetical protein